MSPRIVRLFAAVFFLSLARVAMAAAGDVSPAQPVIPDRAFSLKDFGAVGDGTTSNTGAFKRAVAALVKAGGGRLVVPAGDWLTGPIDLGSAVDLHLENGATIFFSPQFADYGESPRYRPLLNTTGAHDVKISGAGTINGHGEAWWEAAEVFKQEANAKKARSNTMPRPNMIEFERCQRVRVEGVTLTASPKFNLVPRHSQDVTIDGITILNPHKKSPNTDGIDPSLCQRVLITRCVIDTDDDNIAIKSGNPSGTAGVSDVLISDCTFKHGHGCSFGSETNGGATRVTVRNCTFEDTDIGVRFKSDRTRGGLVDEIVYENLTMKNVGQAIVITEVTTSVRSKLTMLNPRSGQGRCPLQPPETAHFIGCFWKNSQMRSLAETFLVVLPRKNSSGSRPGQVWPPSSTE